MVAGSQNVIIGPGSIDDVPDAGLRIEGQRMKHAQDRGKGVVGAAQRPDDNQLFQIPGGVDAAAVLHSLFHQKPVALPVSQRIHGNV